MVDHAGVDDLVSRAPAPTGIPTQDANKLKHLIEAERLWKKRLDTSRAALKIGKVDVLMTAQKRLQELDPHAHLNVAVPIGQSSVSVEPVHASIEKTFLWD